MIYNIFIHLPLYIFVFLHYNISKYFRAAGELSGIYPLKLLGVGIAGTAHVLDPKMQSSAAWSHTNIQLNKIYQKLLELEVNS